MSDQGAVVLPLNEEVALLPAGQTAQPQTVEMMKPHGSSSEEEGSESADEEEEEEEVRSAHLEPSTLPWPGDKDKKLLLEDEDASGSEERDTGISRGSQDLSEERSQAEGDARSKSKWRESMPEVERWRDDVQRKDKGDGSLADDEEEEDKEWISEKHSLGFTPHVEILCPTSKEPVDGSRYLREEMQREVLMEHNSAQFHPEWDEQDDKYYLCADENFCCEKLRLFLSTLAAGLLFPLLVWGGYALLPFEAPQLGNPSLRVLYTLRCSFFATVPIMLGVLVQGVARLRFSALKPLYQRKLVNKEVMVHWHYVNESMPLFLFYFLQLAVMATYISQDLVKLVPLLTIIFVFGRLIYWLCLALDSTVRGFGFGLSFFPILVMLGVNFYYVCSSVGQGSIFDAGPPATDPPPQLRWWF
ncbi:transmembrane protein 79 [Nematolebias whitei]|uniref:transmembrane protein 79 n=1 Tax=Nematolebias whitei TaxID=451745 RepID=UPI00189AB669|nr:transmembrane protein 79 [Nematolebias whitei]